MRCLVSEGWGTPHRVTYFPVGKTLRYAYRPESKGAVMRILISGASIAGPVLAYWLTRYGFNITIVEHAPQLRKTGGHAVDLFRPALDISEKMGVLARIERMVTGTTRMTVYRQGVQRPTRVDL